jgi:hypothetical protein
MKTIKVKLNSKTGEHYIDLKDLSDLVDVKKVKFYEMKIKKDKSVRLKLFDSNKKLIKLKK